MTKNERIAELERRVKDLEDRPPIAVYIETVKGEPKPWPHPYWEPYIWSGTSGDTSTVIPCGVSFGSEGG